ncbi:putative secreted Zn-dependent protease [Hoeflea sp. IMCC20628]|uniref:DUF922 domain-containing Zn-dependent protease n=1 Tax=Hoeflea sp. IMCC20628 TaxID=1620421 RepID=UPI00063BF4F0|nr:DUF922 domain-containing protein [Hoeflea sp. IMCC20628]AKH99647.1 putative secreted Zn-dependent protease [Hoeflea sp. IMCC20628]
MKIIRPIVLTATLLATVTGATQPALAWEAVEQTKTYPVSGQSGAALYEAIGTNGPVIGDGRRTIAHTTFKLTWRRDYQQRGADCVLASAKPKLIITYTLPKPRGSMPSSVASSWKRFADGLAKHERVHGQYIIDMVHAIETVSTGISAKDDPGCNKVRAELQTHLKRLSDQQRARGREFDLLEMGTGGTVQQLVLGLIEER